MDYISSILNKLLDKLDKRKIRNGSTLKRVVSLCTDKDKIFEKYWAEDAYNYRPDIHDAVDFLVQKGFIIAEYDRDMRLLKKVTLNNENIIEAYAFLNRIPKQTIIDEDIKRAKALLTLIEESTVSYRYLSKMISLLESGEAHLTYFKSIDELAISSSIVKEIEDNEDEILLRNFSKKKFKDSKLVERNASKLLRIFNEFDERQYSDFSELCTTHYIVKDKGYALVKQGFCFKINNQVIDLDALNVDFAVSDEAIDSMEIVALNRNKVITIENLTTFHYYNDSDSIIIYLGGYHNSIKRKLLQKIHYFNSKLTWLHMGDIDWGGFEIFIHLKNMTGIDFVPFKMGIDELREHKNECISLTEDDRRKLELLLQNHDAKVFYPTIQFMLKNGYKLEQESIVFNFQYD